MCCNEEQNLLEVINQSKEELNHISTMDGIQKLPSMSSGIKKTTQFSVDIFW